MYLSRRRALIGFSSFGALLASKASAEDELKAFTTNISPRLGAQAAFGPNIAFDPEFYVAVGLPWHMPWAVARNAAGFQTHRVTIDPWLGQVLAYTDGVPRWQSAPPTFDKIRYKIVGDSGTAPGAGDKGVNVQVLTCDRGVLLKMSFIDYKGASQNVDLAIVSGTKLAENVNWSVEGNSLVIR